MIDNDDNGETYCSGQDGEGNCLQRGSMITALAAGTIVEVHVVITDKVQDHLVCFG